MDNNRDFVEPASGAERIRDHVIVGAGPAGLQLAYHLEQAGRDYVVMESSPRVGSFFRTYPRHRKLISINKLYTGYTDREINRRWDWNCLLSDDPRDDFRNYSSEYFPSADDLVRYLEEFAERHQLAIRCSARVVRIDTVDGIFVVTDAHGRCLRARNVVVATGLSTPYIPVIPGIEHSEDYSRVSVDPADFRGQRVLVIGKGNSAFETADNLVATAALIHVASPEPIDFAWRSHYVGHLRAVNNNFLDTYQLKSQNAILDAQITDIAKSPDGLVARFGYEHANEEVESIVYDRVITCTGFRFDLSVFTPACQPDTVHDGKFPDMEPDWQSANIDGLYFAGVLTHGLDYRKKQSGFIHGFRYNVECLAKLLNERYHDAPYPRECVASDSGAVAGAILEDVNRSSALWQQSGFLCSAVVCDEDGTVRYYKNVPIAYAHRRFAGHARYWLVRLDFGQERIDTLGDVFRIDRVHKHDIDNADRSTAIHPIIESCAHGRVEDTHHVIEDLRSEWFDPHHVEPLEAFLAIHLGASEAVSPVGLAPRSSPIDMGQ